MILEPILLYTYFLIRSYLLKKKCHIRSSHSTDLRSNSSSLSSRYTYRIISQITKPIWRAICSFFTNSHAYCTYIRIVYRIWEILCFTVKYLLKLKFETFFQISMIVPRGCFWLILLITHVSLKQYVWPRLNIQWLSSLRNSIFIISTHFGIHIIIVDNPIPIIYSKYTMHYAHTIYILYLKCLYKLWKKN